MKLARVADIAAVKSDLAIPALMVSGNAMNVATFGKDEVPA